MNVKRTKKTILDETPELCSADTFLFIEWFFIYVITRKDMMNCNCLKLC